MARTAVAKQEIDVDVTPPSAEPKRRQRGAPPRRLYPNGANDSNPKEVAPGVKGTKAVRGELNKLSTDGNLVDIWERRMINPDSRGSQNIGIKTPGMKIRWINLAQSGRYQRARYEQGWVPVLKDELVDEREVYGVSYTTSNEVCRGEKQQEMLMKMPIAVWRKIQKARADLNRKSYAKIKESIAGAGSAHFTEKYAQQSGEAKGRQAGEQAADAIGAFQGKIEFGSESVSSDSVFQDQ